MTCFIITYDSKMIGTTKKIEKIIHTYQIHAQIGKNIWAVVTDEEATDIRDKLKTIISPEDMIFVIKSGGEAGWANVICEKSWLHKYLMNEY
jgi:hypothetical protein